MSISDPTWDELQTIYGSLNIVGDLSNKVIEGVQYVTAEELKSLFVAHMGEERWEARQARGVINFDG